MARYLIDEHGEVLAEFKDDVQITSYNVLNKERKKISKKLFFKLYRDSVLFFINEKVNYKYKRTFFKLIRFLEFDRIEILKINGFPAMVSQLSKSLNMNPKTFYNHLKVLGEYELIKKVKDGKKVYIIVNPYFLGYGVSHSDESLQMFSKSVWSQCSDFTKKRSKKDER